MSALDKPKSSVLCFEKCGYFFDSHVVGSALNRPIEENCTVFTNWVRDKPGNSARRHVVTGVIGPDRMVTTFFKVVAGSIPVTSDDVGMVTKSQCDEITTSESAIFLP